VKRLEETVNEKAKKDLANTENIYSVPPDQNRDREGVDTRRMKDEG
jgi:hypothetical protein